jgi:hypothetical protein
VRFRGSQSTIIDLSQSSTDREFPLFTKNAGDVSRPDYAIFLLNKDLAQLRWHFGLVTTDLKNTNRNLYELMCLWKRLSQSSQPRISAQYEYLSPPVSVCRGKGSANSPKKNDDANDLSDSNSSTADVIRKDGRKSNSSSSRPQIIVPPTADILKEKTNFPSRRATAMGDGDTSKQAS